MANGSAQVANQLGLLGAVQELEQRHPESGLLQESAFQPDASVRQGLLGQASPAANLAMQTAAIPVIGDVTGAAADLMQFANEPESRTPGNFAMSALGMLPMIPGSAVTRQAADTLMPFNRAETEFDAVVDVPIEKLTQATTGDPSMPMSRSAIRQMASGSDPDKARSAQQMLERQQSIIDQMRRGEPVDPPVVTPSDSPSGLGIVDGRNRVTIARELGETTIPVRVPRDRLRDVQRAIGGDN